MKSVAIVGSRRFESKMKQFTAALREKGVIVFEPILYSFGEDQIFTDKGKFALACGLTYHSFENIRKADVVFVYNEDSYIGVNTSIELGFAAALGKPIYALRDDDPDELARSILIDKVTPNVAHFLAQIQ